ncbi:L-lactate dehydrogenase 1 [Candidatus Roizmanbacteria bacterium]|nr:L-lactate dehydrogenase 1 [Candidatus Roizmanbacteria bacterium]
MNGKVSIIGGGHVGMSAAFAMLLKNTTRELVLFDRNTDKMKGEQLEFEHSLTFLGTTKITVAESPKDLKDSDVIVFTAGRAQLPGESRLNLVKSNLEVIKTILPDVIKYSPNSVVLMVTNPVDILTYQASQLLKLPQGKIFGSGTSLDSARFRFHLSEFLGINPKNIHAYVLGEHGDSSFPTISHADIGGQPISTMKDFSSEKIQEAFLKTKSAASTIIAAKGSTYYAIGVVINQLVDAVLRDTKRVYPVSVPLAGQYGYNDVSISVPCVIGKNGVEKILEVPLSDEEKKLMDRSVKILKETVI